MSKIGVGVGDDFPVDDGQGRSNAGGAPPPGDDRAEFEEWKRRRNAWRAQRDAWQAQRDDWRKQRDEWRSRRRAFRDQFKSEMRGGFRDDRYGNGYHAFLPGHRVWRILTLVAGIALIVFMFSHIYVLIGILALGALFFAYHRHGHDPFDLGPYDYSQPDPQPAPPTSSAPVPQPPQGTQQ
jgi:hypothetical protein